MLIYVDYINLKDKLFNYNTLKCWTTEYTDSNQLLHKEIEEKHIENSVLTNKWERNICEIKNDEENKESEIDQKLNSLDESSLKCKNIRYVNTICNRETDTIKKQKYNEKKWYKIENEERIAEVDRIEEEISYYNRKNIDMTIISDNISYDV